MVKKKNLTIIISGMAASGKTTLAEKLAKYYKLKIYSGSDALRDFARKLGYNPKGVDWWDTKEGMEFLKRRKLNHEFDKKVDELMMNKAIEGNVVITSWTLPYLKSSGIKIWLNASKEARAKRMANRDGIDIKEARKIIDERDKENVDLYKKIYGFTIGKNLKKFYDIVIDTDNLNEKQVFDKVIKIINKNFYDCMDKFNLLNEMYKNRREEIKKRLEEFKNVLNQNDEKIFAELAFCLCTPQSKATVCWNAIEDLIKNNLLFNGNANQIEPFLKGVRFYKNKSKYIVEAREKFSKIKEKLISCKDVMELREWLLENVKGLGMKECSHFLRNIGLGKNLAILDRHILSKLKEFGVIEEIPKSMSKKKYLEIEEKMRKFSDKVGIPIDELDLLFWSEKTGFVFK
jgi:N-glycosylase/DNA lyase